MIEGRGGARVARLNAEVPELWGPKEVAEAVGCSPQNLRAHPNLPEPCAMLGGRSRGRIWRADVIREYVELRDKRRAS